MLRKKVFIVVIILNITKGKKWSQSICRVWKYNRLGGLKHKAPSWVHNLCLEWLLKPHLWLERLQYSPSTPNTPVFPEKHGGSQGLSPLRKTLYTGFSQDSIRVSTQAQAEEPTSKLTRMDLFQSYKPQWRIFFPSAALPALWTNGHRKPLIDRIAQLEKSGGLPQRAMQRRGAFLRKNEHPTGITPPKPHSKLLQLTCQCHDRRPCFLPSQPCWQSEVANFAVVANYPQASEAG